ncbi:MAG: class I SAM-dependent methyltransferase [Candidatus Hodarchaeota archaeon]
MKNKEFFDANLKRWNELVKINANSKTYDLNGFKKGKNSLFPIELEELGVVKGKSLLHLQCHFGMDTLSWARKGAEVVGVDFSDKAIELARNLSNELNIPAMFIQSNVYDIPNLISKKFDIVFTSYGVLCWLPDLYKWAEVINYCLKPGGTFYVVDSHPIGFLIDEHFENRFEIGYNYFTEGKPVSFDDDKTYVETDKIIKNKTTFEWFHTIGDIVNSIISVDLEIEFLHEFPFCFFPIHPDMKQREDGYWEFQTFKHSVPMIFSLKANKKL